LIFWASFGGKGKTKKSLNMSYLKICLAGLNASFLINIKKWPNLGSQY